MNDARFGNIILNIQKSRISLSIKSINTKFPMKLSGIAKSALIDSIAIFIDIVKLISFIFPSSSNNSLSNQLNFIIGIMSVAVTSTPLPTSPLDLPLASVGRIVKTSLPNGNKSHLDPTHCKVSRDVKSAMARAGGLFVLYLANAANDSAKSHNRQTVNSDDVIAGLEEIEFPSLIEPCLAYIKNHRLKISKGKTVDEDKSKIGVKPSAPRKSSSSNKSSSSKSSHSGKAGRPKRKSPANSSIEKDSKKKRAE